MTNYKWGYVSWYIEIINATNHTDEDIDFDHRYEFNDGSNPAITTPRNPKKEKYRGLAMFPNFGVEAKF
jgi:hypothetical protein